MNKRTQCPFSDPEYEQDMNTPCPVCGALGYYPFRDLEGNDVECIDDWELT
jgi:hypothetical protein